MITLSDHPSRALPYALQPEQMALLVEYAQAYAAAQEQAGRCIWQSIKRGPDGRPDWTAEEWQRPGGWISAIRTYAARLAKRRERAKGKP